MIGGGGGGAGTAAESAATWTAVVRLISSFRSFQDATLPAANPSAQDERRAAMLAIWSRVSAALELRKARLKLQASAGDQRHNQRCTGGSKKLVKLRTSKLASAHRY